MTLIPVIEGDFGYVINFTLLDSQGTAFDLTGVTQLLFRAQKSNLSQTKFTGSMSVTTPPTAGTCSYTVATGNFNTPGQYDAEIEATFGLAEVVTFNDIQISVTPKIPH